MDITKVNSFERLEEAFLDELFVRYIARRFLDLSSLRAVAVELDLNVNSFDRLFTVDPKHENIFNKYLDEEIDKADILLSKASKIIARQRLFDILREHAGADNKEVIQAAKAILTSVNVKDGGKSDGFDKILEDMITREE
ncbi:MAG TPA: hypothetical protein PLQ68_04525 [Clostridia bacterium]|nr:hypothetical protein [Clostridia bacterium]